MSRIFLIVFLFPPAIAFACEFVNDCSPGSKCIKENGQLYGVCIGGISPGNTMIDNQSTLRQIQTTHMETLVSLILIAVLDLCA